MQRLQVVPTIQPNPNDKMIYVDTHTIYPDGFYIAQLINPHHKDRRLIVEILKGGFVENPTFGRRSQEDGLKNCYMLLGRVDLDTLVVKTKQEFRSN